MHVMGARFDTLAAASASLQEIRAAVPVAPGEVAVGPLGSIRYEVPSSGFVLGGRFADADIAVVSRIIEAHGGSVIECRPEAATPAGGGNAALRATVASNPPWTATWIAPTAQPRPARRLATTKAGPRLRKRLRRPAARWRGRAARGHRLADRRQ
jgi:hypothetical protein